MSSLVLAEIIRWVSMGLGIFSFVLSGATYYFFMLRNPPAALVEHVRKVTSAYLAFVIVAMVDTGIRFGEPFRWQLIGYLVVFALSANAQTPLLWYEKKALLKEQLAKRHGDVIIPERVDGPGVWGPPDGGSQETP